MRVSVVQGGGTAPVVTTTTADSASLAPQHVDELRAKVEQADLSSHELQPNQPTYRITVEDGGRSTQVALSESDVTAARRDLIDFVSSVPGHEEQVGPLGR